MPYNFAIQFAIEKSKKLNLPLKIIHPKNNYKYAPKQKFIDRQLEQAKTLFDKSNLDFEIIEKTPKEIIKGINTAALIIDFNPITTRDYLKNADFKIYEIDSHNIIPARFISEKQEYSAATLRTKIYHNISSYLTEYTNLTSDNIEADSVLEDFINNKLENYFENKNNPSLCATSCLSKYLNLGFISSQRVAIEIIKAKASTANKEAFLEELIVRKELADNFCLYSKGFKDFSSIPNWAKISLENHRYDIIPFIYSLEELENARTDDNLWNATQIQLIRKGTIQGYLRMYWAKKIFEWTLSADDALKTAIYLNDKYAYDAPSANGYVGILWAIGGLHDRAFANFPITGKIRRMTSKSIRKKYNLDTYINNHTSLY